MPRIAPWPIYRRNPYLRRFCGALEDHGLSVSRLPWLAVSARLLRRGDWLHLHWPGAELLHRDGERYRRRIDRLASCLDGLRGRGVRIAWTAHNLLPHDDPHPELGAAARRVVLAAADHVFVHFAAAAGELAEAFGHRGPVTVIPHGHYRDDYPAPPAQPAARRRLSLPPRGRIFLVLGHLRPYKNLGEIARGFLAAAAADDRLVVAGSLEGAGTIVADRRIRLVPGRVPAHEVPIYFAAADAFIVAHRAFFTSGSAVLALSMGCPVLGPHARHLAAFGGPPRVFAMEPTAAAIAAAVTDFTPVGEAARAAIRDWAGDELSWREAGRRAARVLGGGA